MEYQKVSSAPFSEKLMNGRSFSGTNIYDGVFSGPMKVGSRVEEDFGEIFGGASSSSIPVLDVPELNKRKISADVNSSKLDYSKIFCGFGEFDFGVSHEEISVKSKKRDSRIKEARTPAEPGSHSSNFSVENQVLSHEASHQSFDGVKQFKMSYNKANQVRRNGTNATTHVTQLHAVPGYTCLINEFAPSHTTEGDGPLSSAINGIHLNTKLSGEIMEGKHSRKASSVHSPGDASKQASRDGVKFENKFNHSRSNSNDVFRAEFAQLHAVPGYNCLINEFAPSNTTEGDKPLLSALNGIHLNTSFSGEKMEGKHGRKASSVHSPGDASQQASSNGVKLQNKFNHSRSNSNDVFFDAFEIGLKTHPSKVPLPSSQSHSLSNNKGDSKKSMGSKIDFTEGASGFCSPPYFEEEVDANSVAAASAAAVKKAIEEAQAKIKIAKDIMERKKNSLQNHVKLGFDDGPKVEKRREGKITDQTNKFREEEWQKCRKVDAPMQLFAGLGMQNAMNAGQVAPDVRERDELLFAKEASGGTHGNKSNSTLTDHRQEEMKDLKSEKGEGTVMKLVRSVNDFELKERFFTMKIFGKPKENSKKLKAFEEVHKQEEVEQKLNAIQGASELKEDVCDPKSGQGVCDQEEYGKKLRVAGLQEEKEVTFETSHKVEAREKRQRRLWDLTGNKLEMLPKDNEHRKLRLLKEEQVWLENEKKRKDLLDQKESDIRSEGFSESEEIEAALEEIFDPKKNGKRDEATCEKVEFEEQQKDSCMLEENGGLEDVHDRKDAENTSDKAQEQGKVEVTIDGFHDGEQDGKKLEEDIEFGAKGNLIEAEENDKRLEESCECWETQKIHREIDPREEYEKMKVNQEACEHFTNNLEVANDACTQDKTEILSETLEAYVHDENNEYMQVPMHEENGGLVEVSEASFECNEMETESNVVDLTNAKEEKGILEFEISGLAQVIHELHDEIHKQVKDTTKAQASEHNGLNMGVSNMDAWKSSNDQHEKESYTFCNAGNYVEELTSESEEYFEDVGEVEAATKRGEDESNSEFSHEERWIDNGENVEATQEGKGESTDMMLKIKTSQNTEHKEDHSETPKTVGRKAECTTMQKEVELQKGEERKLDEVKEKEREGEKERIAVERAIREARERAFTEARERAAAEKANVQANRRAMAETRERLDKASAEVNDKSAADKTSMEARLKAERAAVERATAEARVRALEKAMSEKATLQTRNQTVKSSGASRENGTRHSSASNDSRYKGSGPSRSSGYSNSSNHDVPHSTNKSDGVNGESVQRDKARLESHQRIAERAAKALAEKNMRDQLARKEQAERNRLAGVLDAEVKRWSSGKTGNLRALLSTLQYILGPDSGWHPIPLTDLIAAGAVKKAYRKATLCVHPDKLQQRGASIQHKYTCEKVFDLLKDAWNKFNAEQR